MIDLSRYLMPMVKYMWCFYIMFLAVVMLCLAVRKLRD
jgi:hypothetical protein